MKLSNPYLFIGVLVITVIASGLLCNIVTADISTSDTSSINAVNGSTVVSGDLLIDKTTIRKIPLTSDPTNILREIKNLDIVSVYTSIVTGATPMDVVKNNTYITADGHVSSQLEGPGKVIIDSDGKIEIKTPTTMVWGYKLPYTYAVKNGDSIDLVTNNTTVKTVSSSDISNDTVPTDYVTASELKSWFNSADDGDNVTVDYYLGNFNDNRTGVYGKENIINAFGEDVYGYMRNYTSGAPVMVYTHNATEVAVSNATSVLEYLSGYPTETRAANAREFANGWNNTIIPPHTSAHGKENVSFTAIAEDEADSGSATHGVCPAGRSLRAAILALGNPLPTGMSSDDESILYDYRPTIDVSVTNNGDYPIKIVMWTTGSSGDTQIHTIIYELRDNATYVNSTNSTDE
ncbi:MAG: hypothetical protein LUG89_02355 [Methanosphaera sp.]|nr:hypothetical protein [Methanosphaera sp.]